MSGPTKQNRMSSTTITEPPMARLLCRSSSRNGLRPPALVVTSPPEGTTPTGPAIAAPSGGCMPNPWIKNAVRDVGSEVADNCRDADDDRRAEQHGEVVG